VTLRQKIPIRRQGAIR